MATNDVYQIRIDLRDSKPPIWRRIQVPGNTRLDKLHLIIQTVMGWANYHLHQFVVGETYYGEPHPDYFHKVEDEHKVTLSQLSKQGGFKFIYEYDFSDYWLHDLRIIDYELVDRGRDYHISVMSFMSEQTEND